MTERRASCSCGQLAVICQDDPARTSMCHCLACQLRTGSVFAVQARWPTERTRIEGRASQYVRTGDSGAVITFQFCPTCGSTVAWSLDRQPELVAVAVGAFADPGFPAPTVSVYGLRRHPWVQLPDGVEHWD